MALAPADLGGSAFDRKWERLIARTRERDAIEKRKIGELSAHRELDVGSNARAPAACGRAMGSRVREGRRFEDRGSGVEILGRVEILVDPHCVFRRARRRYEKTEYEGETQRRGPKSVAGALLFHAA